MEVDFRTGSKSKVDFRTSDSKLNTADRSVAIVNGIRLKNESVYHTGFVTLDIDPSEITYVESHTTEEWSHMTSYIPEKNTIIVYTDYKKIEKEGVLVNVPGIKIADGLAYVVDLPFVTEEVEKELLSHIENNIIHITNQEREF